jgi:hypothetical protein
MGKAISTHNTGKKMASKFLSVKRKRKHQMYWKNIHVENIFHIFSLFSPSNLGGHMPVDKQ